MRNCALQLWIVSAVLYTTCAQWLLQPPKKEGEECGNLGGKVWTCQKESDCDVLSTLISKGRVITCSKQGRSNIICCPQPSLLNRISSSISERKCLEYQRRICNSNTPRFDRAGIDKDKDVGTDNVGTENPDSIPTLDNVGTENPDIIPSFKPHYAIGGWLARARKHPHMALIGYGSEDSVNWQCGGSLISERFVLSAAHCSDTPYGPARWVRVGDLDIRSDADDARPQQFEIVQRMVHDGYTPPAFYNDIILFRLDRDAIFDDYVRPACLYTNVEDPLGIGLATGWGRNETYGPRSSALVEVDLRFIPFTECNQSIGIIRQYLPEGLNNQTMMCAGSPGKDTCQGDSGGPLILQGGRERCLATQVGVTSFGPKQCGMTSATGIYVRVAHFLPWIEAIVWPE